MIDLCSKRAFATSYISASVPVYLKVFKQYKIKRQLLCTYPSEGTILSTLGERGQPPFLLQFSTNCMFVNSQRPVHRDDAHSSVKLKGMFFRFARCLIAIRNRDHGYCTWRIFSLASRFLFAISLWAACHILAFIRALFCNAGEFLYRSLILRSALLRRLAQRCRSLYLSRHVFEQYNFVSNFVSKVTLQAIQFLENIVLSFVVIHAY